MGTNVFPHRDQVFQVSPEVLFHEAQRRLFVPQAGRREQGPVSVPEAGLPGQG